MLVTVVWEALAAAVTSRRCWLPGLSAVLLGIGLLPPAADITAHDTFIVRTLVIPALFALIGDRIWWPADLNHAKPADQQADLAPHEWSTP